MKLSAFTVLDTYLDLGNGGPDRYQQFLDLAVVSERHGLEGIWAAEHHFRSSGVCPSPAVLLAAASQLTHRLKLGCLVSVLPLHDPISVAEEYALVDRLSGGRLRLGVGSGYLPVEFEGFGVDAGRKRELFDRSLAVVLNAFAGSPVAQGARGESLRLNVTPVQRPHPPIWVAAQRRESLPYVAQQGHSVAMLPYATVPDLAALASAIASYRENVPRGSAQRVAVAVHLHVGSDRSRARAALQRYLDSRGAAQASFLSGRDRVAPCQVQARTIEEAGFALFGTARQVEEGLDVYRRMGVDELLGIFDFGGLRTAEVHESVLRVASRFAPPLGEPSPSPADPPPVPSVVHRAARDPGAVVRG